MSFPSSTVHNCNLHSAKVYSVHTTTDPDTGKERRLIRTKPKPEHVHTDEAHPVLKDSHDRTIVEIRYLDKKA